jgi:hypothetical protein
MTDYRGSLVDDDGVLVVSTTRQMAVIGSRGFDYDFPGELLALMVEGRIVAWETGGEDDFPVEVVFADKPPAGSHGAFRLSVLADDTGIVMPYSQFSYAADCADGVVAVTPGLALRFPISSGEHHVFLGASPSGFSITITPAQHSLAPITDDLPLIQAIGA